jgi:hypothetical protein
MRNPLVPEPVPVPHVASHFSQHKRHCAQCRAATRGHAAELPRDVVDNLCVRGRSLHDGDEADVQAQHDGHAARAEAASRRKGGTSSPSGGKPAAKPLIAD